MSTARAPRDADRSMFRITRKADYAVFILSFLARRRAEAGADELVSAQELASFSSLNKSLVANLLKDLNRAGFLDSVRGARGGYRLARPPQQITLAAILRTVEGPFTFVECASERLGEDHGDLDADGFASADDTVDDDDTVDGDDAVDLDADTDAFAPDGSAARDARADHADGIQTSIADRFAREATARSGFDGRTAPHSHDGACCNLSPLCTSQGPLLVLHFRIQQLLEEITLTELSGLDRTRVASIAEELFPARDGARAASRSNGHAPVAARAAGDDQSTRGALEPPAPETTR